MHFDTSVIVGASADPREISSQSSSAKGPPPLKTILGLNLIKQTIEKHVSLLFSIST